MILKTYAKLGEGMMLQPIRFELQQHSLLTVPAVSTAAEALPEVTVYCPFCDFCGATAVQHQPNSPDHHITCSNCGFDGDRNKIFLVP